jgi:hypothetical protein
VGCAPSKSHERWHAPAWRAPSRGSRLIYHRFGPGELFASYGLSQQSRPARQMLVEARNVHCQLQTKIRTRLSSRRPRSLAATSVLEEHRSATKSSVCYPAVVMLERPIPYYVQTGRKAQAQPFFEVLRWPETARKSRMSSPPAVLPHSVAGAAGRGIALRPVRGVAPIRPAERRLWLGRC